MAIRINYIDGGGAPPQASLSSAMARGRAAAEFGSAVEGVAQQGFNAIAKAREIKETGDRMSFMANVDKEATDFNISLIGRSDYTNWPEEFKQLTDKWKSDADSLNLSPAGRNKLDAQLMQSNSNRSNQLATTAALRDYEEGKARASNSYNFALETGDPDAIQRAEGELQSFLSPAELEKTKHEGKRIAQNNALIRQAIADPQKAEEFLQSDEGKKMAPADQLRMQNVIQDQKREQAYGFTEKFNNMRADGSIVRPEQVDQYFQTASPALRAEMKRDLQRQFTQEQLAARKTPQYEAFVIGEVNSMLDGYQAEMKDFDVSFYKMDTLVRTLPESEAKARLNFRIDSVRKNQQEEWQSVADDGRNMLKQGFQGGAFGLGVAKKPLREIVASGLLHDPKKLHKRGLPDKEVKMIVQGKADEEYLKGIGMSEPAAERLSKMTGVAASLELFRELDKRRDLAQVVDANEEFDAAAMDAISSNTKDELEYPDAAADQAAKEKYGTAVKEFENWYRVNPNATQEDINKKVYGLFSPEGQRQFREMLVPPPPNEASGALLPDYPGQ
jgi:hypothetical protein